MPIIKESNSSIKTQDWKFLKNYKNSISNLKLNINLYYKFSNKIPSTFKWFDLKDRWPYLRRTLESYNQLPFQNVMMLQSENQISLPFL